MTISLHRLAGAALLALAAAAANATELAVDISDAAKTTTYLIALRPDQDSAATATEEKRYPVIRSQTTDQHTTVTQYVFVSYWFGTRITAHQVSRRTVDVHFERRTLDGNTVSPDGLTLTPRFTTVDYHIVASDGYSHAVDNLGTVTYRILP